MSGAKKRGTFKGLSVAAAAIAMLSGFGLVAQAGPGGGPVQPVSTGRADHYFQHFVVQIGLERLGYDVKEHLEAQFPAMHLAIAQGDADYTAVHWDPLHKKFYEQAGGDKKLQRIGRLVEGAAQGYLIDKRTAQDLKIDNLSQFNSSDVAGRFDTDGDGKANLTGCNPGWGCETVIEHQLDAYNLRGSINHDQGEYFALIADTIARYKNGESVLYYTWSPLWVSSVLKPGEDVVWLDVPFTALPDEREAIDTSLPNGRNPGFAVNSIRILANKDFLDKNPVAKRFFELVKIPIADVNAAILRQQEGEKSLSEIRQHAEEWVAENRDDFDAWLAEAKAAGD